jgi:hypothetical protein
MSHYFFFSKLLEVTAAECVHALKGLALPRASHSGDSPAGLMSPTFHAYILGQRPSISAQAFFAVYIAEYE